jgi:transposase
MSYSFERLAALIRTELNKDVITSNVFIFLNKQRTTIKIMVYDDKGFSIFYRRLDEGSFQVPVIVSDVISYNMSEEQMVHMLQGLSISEGGYL